MLSILRLWVAQFDHKIFPSHILPDVIILHHRQKILLNIENFALEPIFPNRFERLLMNT